MKKVIKFSKAFLPCVIVSLVLIISGIIGLYTKGINLGIDFQAGFIEKVRIAPTAFILTYNGSQSVTVSQSSTEINFVVTGVGSDNQTYHFPYVTYPTLGDLNTALGPVQGVSLQAVAPAETVLKNVFPDSEVLARLSATPYRFHYVPTDSKAISADEIRNALSVTYADAAVQVVGKPEDRLFQIRLKDDGSDANASINMRAGIASALSAVYGEENVAVINTDFVGSRFSKSLSGQALWLLIATLALIWVYATFRFRWDFALGAVLAVTHDALIMITFIVWTQMQFNSITIAAILTIIGYSINDTIVVYDRIRENLKFHQDGNLTDVLNLSQTEVLSRTIITTVTTMLAVFSLYIFTSGDMKDFALALLVGMTSGVYSTIYIASAFVSLVSHFRKDGGKIVEKKKAILSTGGEVV